MASDFDNAGSSYSLLTTILAYDPTDEDYDVSMVLSQAYNKILELEAQLQLGDLMGGSVGAYAFTQTEEAFRSMLSATTDYAKARPTPTTGLTAEEADRVEAVMLEEGEEAAWDLQEQIIKAKVLCVDCKGVQGRSCDSCGGTGVITPEVT